MIIKGKNAHMTTDYYSDTFTVDIDVDEIEFSEIVDQFGSDSLLHEMEIKDIVDFLDIQEIISNKSLDLFFENNEDYMIGYLIEKKGEGWICSHLSDSTIKSENRERTIDNLL